MSDWAAFEKTFDVRFCEVDPQARVTPVALLNYLLETTLVYSRSIGRSAGELAEQGLAWVMTRFHLRLDRYPHWEQRVHVRAWGSKMKGIIAIWEYHILDDAGETLGAATTRWIMIDMKRRRPTRLADWLVEAYHINPRRLIDDKFEDLPPVLSTECSRTFHVRLSDLDPNQHANSASYLDWCLETCPSEVQETMVPRSIELAFKQETGPGEPVLVETQSIPSEPGTAATFAHTIKLNGQGTLLASARSGWQPDPNPDSNARFRPI